MLLVDCVFIEETKLPLRTVN